MDDPPAAAAPALDPTTSDPRELMRAVLPPARAEYIKAWELLADAATPLERRRLARERAKSIAADHSIVARALRDREPTLSGDDLLNARHLAGELERHADAMTRIAEISPVGLQTAQSLRPEALGCGKRYRDPAKAPAGGDDAAPRGKRGGAPGGPGRGGAGKPGGPGGRPGGSGGPGRPGGDGRRSSRPFEDRGPKVSRDALGSSKHDSQLGDDLDEATRAKLEEMRRQLEG
jgi:translation initiation factor IF-2